MKICNGIDYLDQVKELIIEYTKRLGRDLSFQNIDEELGNPAKKYTAKKAGYKEMVLDTIIPLQVAIQLYKKVGFVEREAYYHNPMDDVLYFKKIL